MANETEATEEIIEPTDLQVTPRAARVAGAQLQRAAWRLEEAYNAHYAEMYPRLTGLARLKGVPPEVAKELTQDTLAKSWTNWSWLSEAAPQSRLGWTYRVMSNAICDYWRHALYAPSRAESLEDLVSSEREHADALTVTAADMEGVIMTRMALGALERRFLATGRVRQWTVLVAWMQGYSQGETAARMSTTTHAVKDLLRRARAEAAQTLVALSIAG